MMTKTDYDRLQQLARSADDIEEQVRSLVVAMNEAENELADAASSLREADAKFSNVRASLRYLRNGIRRHRDLIEGKEVKIEEYEP